MSELPPCPECQSPYCYEDGALLTCPECGHSFDPAASAAPEVRDANGAPLADGDAVTVIKDLKFRGGVVKQGTKAKSIRLIPPQNGHDIECKLDGHGVIQLKSEFVKKL